MEWMISLAQLLLSLSILVAVHEMGHLLAAKYFGMRVEQFSIGFPPKIWSFKKGETEYAISAIPLGGYVKISGMIDESLDSEAMKQDPQPWEFRSKPAWQRLIVMLGGIFVNVIIGIMIFIGITWVYGDSYTLKDAVNNNGGFAVGALGEKIGLKSGDKIIKINGNDYQFVEDLLKAETLLSANLTYTIDRNGEIMDVKIPHNLIEEFSSKQRSRSFLSFRIAPIVGAVEENKIAANVGLKPGDQIVEVNGVRVQYVDQIRAALKKDTVGVAFSVLRAGNTLSFNEKFAAGDSLIGFDAKWPVEFIKASEHIIHYTFAESVPVGTERAFTTLVTQVKAFGKMISGKLNPQKSLSGPIGIMDAFGTDWDWERFWSLTGVLSLVLAFMNLLPIPALDGGHVMFLTYEIVSRRKPSDKFLENAQKVGMVFLLALMVFIFANDIFKKFQ